MSSSLEFGGRNGPFWGYYLEIPNPIAMNNHKKTREECDMEDKFQQTTKPLVIVETITLETHHATQKCTKYAISPEGGYARKCVVRQTEPRCEL